MSVIPEHLMLPVTVLLMAISFAAGAFWRRKRLQRTIRKKTAVKPNAEFQRTLPEILGSGTTEPSKSEPRQEEREAAVRKCLDQWISDDRITTCAVAIVNVDRLKLINDTVGYRAGDQLLSRAEERLKVCEGNRVFHFKGDEFAVLFQNMGAKDVTGHLERIIRAFSLPIQLDDKIWYESVTIGASIYPDDAEDGRRLLRCAKSALHHAKKVGRGHYRLFDPAIRVEQSRRLEIEMDLRKAAKENQFFLCYQPQVDLNEGRLIGTEALIRWRHPKRGILSPAVFIPVAEEIGLIDTIGEWVLYEACRQTKRWNDQGYGLNISVNLSPKQLFQGRLVETVRTVLRQTGLAPGRLQLELTETADADLTVMAEELAALRKLHVGISIDDFGTGYNSLNYLKKLPLSQLKIDRSFLMGEGREQPDEALVRLIVELAGQFHLMVVAEGVENRNHIRLLKQTHCGVAQGYLFGRPLPPDQFERELASICGRIREHLGREA